MKNQTNAPKEKKKSKVGLGAASQIFFCLFAATFLAVSAYAFLLFVFAMLPTIVTVTVDKRPGKYASSTVGVYNFMGVLPYFIEMAKTGEINASAQSMIINMNTWFYIYGTACIGCIMIWSVPQIVSLFFTVKMKKKVEELKREQQKLVEVWGERIRML